MQDFRAKQNALFACLDDASKEIKGTILDQSDYPRSSLNRNHITDDNSQNLSFLRGKESIFKKPELPITRCLKARRTPDYQINPQKWKKYSLSDVDISDQTNKAAAFAFLKQMDDQHDTDSDNIAIDANERASTSHTKIEFKRKSKITRNMRAIESNELADAEVDKPKLKGSKLVMPEYIVGQKRVDRKRKRNNNQNEERIRAAGSLRLTHLQEDDDVVESDENDDEIIAER